jgi:hypothetical protein
LGLLGLMRMASIRVNQEFLEHFSSQPILGQHPFNRFADEFLGPLFQKISSGY